MFPCLGTAGPWKIKPHIVILWSKRVIPSRTPSVWPEKAWTEVVLFQQYSKVFPEDVYPKRSYQWNRRWLHKGIKTTVMTSDISKAFFIGIHIRRRNSMVDVGSDQHSRRLFSRSFYIQTSLSDKVKQSKSEQSDETWYNDFLCKIN